jgi:hypothetical protein
LEILLAKAVTAEERTQLNNALIETSQKVASLWYVCVPSGGESSLNMA